MLVDGFRLMEIKAVQEVAPIHKDQRLSDMKLLDVPLGLPINFYEMRLTEGPHRLMLPGSGRD